MKTIKHRLFITPSLPNENGSVWEPNLMWEIELPFRLNLGDKIGYYMLNLTYEECSDLNFDWPDSRHEQWDEHRSNVDYAVESIEIDRDFDREAEVIINVKLKPTSK